MIGQIAIESHVRGDIVETFGDAVLGNGTFAFDEGVRFWGFEIERFE